MRLYTIHHELVLVLVFVFVCVWFVCRGLPIILHRTQDYVGEPFPVLRGLSVHVNAARRVRHKVRWANAPKAGQPCAYV